MSKKTLEQAVTEYNDKHGYDNSPEGMYETFIEVLSDTTVQEDTEYESRWYDLRNVVHQVTIDGEKRYFKTFDYHITGDNSASDMGLKMPTLEDVTEVFAEEVVTTIYR